MNTHPSIPTTRRRVWLFVRDHFGLELPARSFTPGHSTPLDFVTDAILHPGKDIAAWACRSGGKTLGASIIAAVEFAFVDGLEARVISGSADQADNLYHYWLRWLESGLLAARVQSVPTRRMVRIAAGKLQVLPASARRIRGPKVQRLFRDEIDEADPELLAASIGMLASRDGVPARVIDASTWHHADGPMARLVTAADAAGVRLHKWGVWEALERCPVDRHDDGRGCDKCPLEKPCRQKAADAWGRPDPKIGIAAHCCGLLRIDDAAKNFRRWSKARWAAEAECRRPTAQGLVFAEFDPARHACRQPPENLTVYRSIDWGCGVFVCLWIGEDARGHAVVLDTYRAEGGTVHRHAEYIRNHALADVRETFCDPAGRNRNDQTGQSNVEVFRQYGIECRYRTDSRSREVANGLALVRAALDPADGPPRLHYVPTASNAAFVTAMQSYHNRRVNNVWINEPADPQEHEHIPDALRYYFVNRQASPAIGVVRFGAR